MRKSNPVPEQPRGSITAAEIMLVREACLRLGWARKTLTHAKKTGLRTIRFGRFDYVRGADILSFFSRLAEPQASGEGQADAS